ncbi:uncharacterized protein LOC144687126 [Cetorhinus maximus]
MGKHLPSVRPYTLGSLLPGIIERKSIDLLQKHMLMIQVAELQKETPPVSPASSAISILPVNILTAGTELIRFMKPIKIMPPIIDDEVEVETEIESDAELLFPLNYFQLRELVLSELEGAK